MKINVKKILALVSSAVISLNLICGSICSAETVVPAYSDSVHTDTDVSVQGTDVFGNMLAAELQSAQDEQIENSGQNIFSVEMTGKTVTVEYDVLADCAVVVGIYDESGTTMIASGNADLSAEENSANVTISIDTMPQYYYIKAFLIDKVTMRPLCSVYENPMYTQEMQEFLAKTVDDFDADKVYNLDDDKSNNFAVFNDEVKVIPDNLSVRWKLYNASTGYYNVVIYSPDEISKSLKPGDIFSYKDAKGNYGIDKVAYIEDEGQWIKVYIEPDDNLELEDVFDYVKVDGESLSEDCTATPTGEEDDGVTYLGMTVEAPAENVSVGYAAENTYYDEESLDAVSISGTATVSHEFKIEKEFKSESNNGIGEGTTTVSAKLSASLKFSASASAKVYITLEEQYVEMKLDYSAKISATFTGSAKLEVPLGQELGFAICPGVFVGITPKIIAEISASITLEGTLSGTVGFKCDGKSLTNLSTAPKFETKLKVEGKYYLGFSLSPRIILISKYVASAGMEAQVGVEITAKSDIFQWDSTRLVKHDCSDCITGDISAKLTVGFDITFLNMEDLKFSITAFEKTWKLFDYYYSNISGFDFGSCPNKSYKTRIIVYDNTLNKVNDAVITVDGNVISSDSYEAYVYLKKGTHTFKAESPNFRTSTKSEEIKAVSTKPNEIMLIMYEKDYSGSGGISNSNGGSGGSGGSGVTDDPSIDIGIEKKRLSLGWAHSAYITENGDLYTWGDNSYIQLGDVKNTDRYTPVKIMSNVSQVSLEHHMSACITQNGDLYTWGMDMLGNGDFLGESTPVKIMSNVSQVSLGEDHRAFITVNGDLYTWGRNNYGQLGDGTTNQSYSPVKIMSNVSQVSLGGSHSACITVNGDLYTWGYNNYGQLGDGTTTNRNTPIKIMSNVYQVSLGYSHSACITQNGDLYTWGWNYSGELGDGTTTSRYTPVKILSNVAQVSLGFGHSACITTNGDLYTWGYNYDGQLGNGTTTSRYTPVKIMSNVAQVSLGGSHSACITANGDLYTWGENFDGQLGDGTTTNSSVPIKITIPDEDEAEDEVEVEALSASPVQQFTGLLPNEVYNIYSMNSRTADEPFSSDNLLYIDQKMSDSEGNLTVNISTNKSGINPEIFVKAMNGGEINNAVITSVKESDGAVSIGWETVEGADKYTVYTIRNGIFIKEADISGLNYTVDGLISGTEYGFIIQAWVNGEYSVLDKSDAVYIIPEKELSIEECIDMVNNLLNTSDDEVYLTDEQLKAIERVLAYDKGILS